MGFHFAFSGNFCFALILSLVDRDRRMSNYFSWDLTSFSDQSSVIVGVAFVIIFMLQFQDYGLESDETRIYNAAHLMVASLAGSLAHVTCKVLFFHFLPVVTDVFLFVKYFEMLCGFSWKLISLLLLVILITIVRSFRSRWELQYQVNWEIRFRVWILQVNFLSRLSCSLLMITLILGVLSSNKLPQIR